VRWQPREGSREPGTGPGQDIRPKSGVPQLRTRRVGPEHAASEHSAPPDRLQLRTQM